MSKFSQADSTRVKFNEGQKTHEIVESAHDWQYMETVRGPRAAEALIHVASDAYRAMDAYSSAYAENQKLRKTLGFFASVIKSGEPWTETCEREYQAATTKTEGGE